MLDTSISQEARFFTAYLRYCTENPKPVAGMAAFWLRDKAEIVVGAPLAKDPESFEERVQSSEFSKFCLLAEAYLEHIGMVKIHKQYVRTEHTIHMPPQEIGYVRVTRFGSFYLVLPEPLQTGTLYLVYKAQLAAKAWKRFKWLGTFTSLVLGVTGWNKTHQLSGVILFLAGLGGLAVTWLLSAVTDFFIGDDHLGGNDP